jgi:hypothetical protein
VLGRDRADFADDGLSAPVITKLTETWKAEQQAFSRRDLSGVWGFQKSAERATYDNRRSSRKG